MIVGEELAKRSIKELYDDFKSGKITEKQFEEGVKDNAALSMENQQQVSSSNEKSDLTMAKEVLKSMKERTERLKKL
jgi:hypothetical protein